MASLSVRQLDEETVERLRTRAVSHGVSMEEEAETEAIPTSIRLSDKSVVMAAIR